MAVPGLLDQLNVQLLYTLFGLEDEQRAPHLLAETARQVRATLPQLVLAVAQRDGVVLGSGGTDVLARARARAKDYAKLVADLDGSARVVKGGSLARHYPADLLRPVGDLDLVAADSDGVWRAALALCERRTIREIAVILHGSKDPSPFVVLEWDAADPWLDRPLKAEICVTPLVGDLGAVGMRALDARRLGVYADVVALCEEGFQRPFNPKDIADVLALADAGVLGRDELVAVVTEHHLAPELERLLGFAARYCDIGPLAGALPAVELPAKRERERRGTRTGQRPPPAASHPVRRHLAEGRPARSVTLRTGGPGRPVQPAKLRVFRDHLLYLTPVGDFLFTVREEVSVDDYEAALALLDRLDTGTAHG
jgi:hypothetical protein